MPDPLDQIATLFTGGGAGEYFGEPVTIAHHSLQCAALAEEAGALETRPYAADAVAVRRWDDAAKDPLARVPGFDHYRPLLQRLLQHSHS